jgi:hypothetical protein
MSGIGRANAPTIAQARAARATQPVDTSLSSTTPDVPRRPQFLPPAHTMAWGLGIGLAAGALLLRTPGAGLGLGALASGAWKGGVLGAGLGASLVGLDHLTGGAVKQQLDLVSLDRRAQIGFVLRHPTEPWLLGMGLGVARDARAAQEHYYGTREPLDGPQDAFRHTYAAALFSLRAMRGHGLDPSAAHELAIQAGAAHEADGQDNNDAWSSAMDTANNLAGTKVVGDGRALAGEQADERGFVTEAALRERVLGAMADGAVQVVDRTGSEPSPRPTDVDDLPPFPAG